MPDVHSSVEALIRRIETWCRLEGIALSTFGHRVVNDGKLVSRLRDGKGVTLATVARIEEFLSRQTGENIRSPSSNEGETKMSTAVASKPAKTTASTKKATKVASKVKTGEQPATDTSRQGNFRFYDNRQNYLSFINTCNEKSAVVKRISKEFQYIHPTPPAFRMFDAGMGDATVLSDCMRDLHKRFPTVPLVVVAKEISMEDVRIGLDKMVDRFSEHPATVLVLTNLNYAEAPRLSPRDLAQANAMNWQEVRLQGTNSYGYKEQLEGLHDMFADGWATAPSPKTGNPLFRRPSVVVIYREDHQILLDAVIPKPGIQNWKYDFILASQPWRARTSAEFKAEKIVAPLVRCLAAGGRFLAIQSCGDDPALEIVREFWPDENPFPVRRNHILRALKHALGREVRDYNIKEMSDAKSIFPYKMHTLPTEIGSSGGIGTSTLFAAWNAAIYVNQIEDQRVEEVIADGNYLKVTAKVLSKYGGLWFNDEIFVVSKVKA